MRTFSNKYKMLLLIFLSQNSVQQTSKFQNNLCYNVFFNISKFTVQILLKIKKNMSAFIILIRVLSNTQMETQKRVEKINCVRSISRIDLFKESLGQLFSQKYLLQQEKLFDKQMFIFQVSTRTKSWSLFKQFSQINDFLSSQTFRQQISKHTLDSLKAIATLSLEQKGQLFEETLAEIITLNQKCISLPFFEQEKSSFHSFMMKKLSGGRYKQNNCCKLGAIFQGWKERKVNIYLKGIGYYNQKNEMRQFLSFSQGFYFQYGRPKTGKQFGIFLYANHRKLCLQAKNIRDFIYFLFILRRTCQQSCYMTLNRYNSFAPIRNSNRVKFLIDGQQYFQQVNQLISKSKISILITGWMLSPQFLLVREVNKVTFQSALLTAAKRGVKISIVLYHESCFLPNDSLYFKQKLQAKSENIKVIRHPCGKLPVLWSHHGKMIISDERQALIGGFDVCYGRYDDDKHQIFASESEYPGIQYNNIRINDQLQVKNYKFPAIMRSQPRLPWHDVGVQVAGKAVSDLVHHFYQLWHFVRYQNKLQEEADYAPSLFEVDVKSVFSTKMIPQQEKPKTFFNNIQNKLHTFKKTIKVKGKQMIKKVKKQINKIGKQQKQQSKIRIRLSASQDYFQKYMKEVNYEIQQKKIKEHKKNDNKNKRRGSRMAMRYSVDEVKQVKETLQKNDQSGEEGGSLRKTNSFILAGDKIVDFMSIDIDKDYMNCLERVKQKRPENSSTITKDQIQIQSDSDQGEISSQMYEGKYSLMTLEQGHDQCQVIRSVGNWSIGCHPSNTQFSVQIAYLQLISQAKNYIYIENQFFISSTADMSTVKNEVAYALYLRILKAIQKQQDFRVYIVLPLIPGFSGDIENQQCLMLRRQMQWQYDTICRSENSLWKRLLSHTNDPGRYIHFFGLRNHGRFNEQSDPKTQIIYLHSKIMIIDDQIVLCGSANINDRSLVGDRDSQIAIVTRGQDFIEGVINQQKALVSQVAQQLRLKLWKQHFCLQEEDIIDPASSATWQRLLKRAEDNTLYYRQIFGCYPDDLMTTRKRITQIRQDSDLSLYDNLKNEIKGHIVDFPLDFLCDEQLNCFITQKQFYMPAECLT